MMNLSYLFIPNEYSFLELIFSHNKRDEKSNKENKENKELNIDKKPKNLSEQRDKLNIKKTNFNEHQKRLILKLESSIDNFIFRKKVKNIIKKTKSYYMIQSTTLFPNLYLKVINAKKFKRYKLVYDPILKQNVAFIPKKSNRNKKKLKFVIENKKDEIFIEPIYPIEYKDSTLFNVIDLQKIEEKEYEDERNFNLFLNEYLRENKKEESEEESSVSSLGKLDDEVKYDKHEFKNNIKIKDKTLSPKATSILKKKSEKRIKTGRKISFGSVEFSY